MLTTADIAMSTAFLRSKGVREVTVRTIEALLTDDGMATMTQCKAALKVSRWTVERWAKLAGARKVNGTGRNGGKFDLTVLKAYQTEIKGA